MQTIDFTQINEPTEAEQVPGSKRFFVPALQHIDDALPTGPFTIGLGDPVVIHWSSVPTRDAAGRRVHIVHATQVRDSETIDAAFAARKAWSKANQPAPATTRRETGAERRRRILAGG